MVRVRWAFRTEETQAHERAAFSFVSVRHRMINTVDMVLRMLILLSSDEGNC